jgi:2-polyprenyl-3-methyl-5-hydroxy-6-metoxy-1,4-benzoquinol methylase
VGMENPPPTFCPKGWIYPQTDIIQKGVDPAARSIEAAQKHTSEKDLTIDYRVGQGEALPFPDGCFEEVACCDFLEHVDDLDKTVSEAARVLNPGGVFFYETVNRTWQSKLVLINIFGLLTAPAEGRSGP